MRKIQVLRVFNKLARKLSVNFLSLIIVMARRVILSGMRFLVCLLFFVSVSPVLQASVKTSLAIQRGWKPTRFWLKAIKEFNSEFELKKISKTSRRFSPIQRQWIHKIGKQVKTRAWKKVMRRVEGAFPTVDKPPSLRLVFGNQAGQDAFTYGEKTICLDVEKWEKNYGAPNTKESIERINRILAHEYAHLLTKQFLKNEKKVLDTPYQRAIHTLYYEGIGHYFSLSKKWVDRKGKLTAYAKNVLKGMLPVLKKRLKELKVDQGSLEKSLTTNMISGPFSKKWGVVPVALWLVHETSNRSKRLAYWVARGPIGIEFLIKKHTEK